MLILFSQYSTERQTHEKSVICFSKIIFYFPILFPSPQYIT